MSSEEEHGGPELERRLVVLPDDAHNGTLVRNVHPPTWRNPKPEGRYNLVVVGAGTAGLVASIGAGLLGANVALVERHLMGGDCLNFGCVPSKGLLRSAHAAEEARSASELGLRLGSVDVDFAAAMERMRRVRAQISEHDAATTVAGFGVEVHLGEARFVAKDAIEVGGHRLEFSRAVIATGGRAAMPRVPGLAEIGPLTNETLFSLTARPRRLAVLGGGAIGCEMGQAMRRLGSEVTIVDRGERLLRREDKDAAEVLARRFEREWIRVLLGAEVLEARASPAGKVLVLRSREGVEELVCDAVLVAAGRAPNVEGLGLEAAGIALGEHGIEVDDHLRTTNRRVFAAGDVCSRFKLTHAADAMARIALENALFFRRRRASDLVIPWCTYTDPEIAQVGLTDAQARARGGLQTFTLPLSEVDRAVVDGDDGFVRVHADRRGRILGATAVSRRAGEMLSEVVLAMTSGLGLPDIARSVHAYPTQSDAWRRLGDEFNRKRLVPWLERLLRRYFRWRR